MAEIPEYLLKELEKEIKNVKVNESQKKKILERMKREYTDALIHPGEAIGMITAESFGEPGTQMSICSSEKIIFKIKNKVKIMKIGKFVDRLMQFYGSYKFNDTEVLPLNDFDIFVPSLNQEEKIEWKKVAECSRHKTNKKLLKLVTRSGRKIIATDNHSFITREDNKVVPVVGRDLKLGDRIPVINNFYNKSPISCIELKDFNKDPLLFLDEGMLSKNGITKPVKNKIELDEETGWFVGAYLAEGTANNYSISISNINDSYIKNAKVFIDGLGLNYTEDFHHRGFTYSRDLKVNSVLLSRFVTLSCGVGSNYKRVPDFAFNANDEFVAGLLRGYFDGDANFQVSRKMIRVSSNSRELTNGISLLLSRFRIFSYKVKDAKGQYWILIPYKYAPQFLLYINSDIEHKRRELEQLADLAKNFWNHNSQDYNDMISGFGDIFRVTAKKLAYPSRYINNFDRRQKIGRTALFRYIKLFESMSEEKKIDIKEELNILRRMFYSDIVWDEIEKMKYVDNDDYVYDLSVPGLETFTTFEGIVTHNTLNTFHFAGVAEVNVTLGLPRLIEILDARKEIKTPTMEIHLKSDYSKDPNKVRVIASQIKETKFFEVVSEFSIDVEKLQVEATPNKKKMREFGITENYLLDTLSKSMSKVTVKQYKDGTIVFKPKETEENLLEIYKLKEKIKNIHVKGIKGVTQAMPVKNGPEFIIITSGSNLKDVLELKQVDETKTTTNNIFEMYSVLGVEAARQSIIKEASTVIQDQGLDVDIRHIMVLADLMTFNGVVKGVTRSGITSEKESVLARASFETPVKHIFNAALIGEIDKLTSVVENVMLNQPVPLGTGLPDLIVKIGGKKNG